MHAFWTTTRCTTSRSDCAIAIVVVSVIGLGAAPGALQDRAEVGVRMRFPEGIDLTGLSIAYFLTGPSGGFGSFVRTSPDLREYVVETSREGQPADMIRAIVYCPGYQIVLFAQPIADDPNEIVPMPLEPLGWLPLSGRIIGIGNPQRASIQVVYFARWGHEFFGIIDGRIASFTVASATLGPDGSFVTRVPDFVHHQVVASRPASERGSLQLIAHEDAPYLPYRLELAAAAGAWAELPVAETYPQDLVLVASTGR